MASNLSHTGPSGLPMDGFPYITHWLVKLDEIPVWKNSEPGFGH